VWPRLEELMRMLTASQSTTTSRSVTPRLWAHSTHLIRRRLPPEWLVEKSRCVESTLDYCWRRVLDAPYSAFEYGMARSVLVRLGHCSGASPSLSSH
jgi:hypothetical protein